MTTSFGEKVLLLVAMTLLVSGCSAGLSDRSSDSPTAAREPTMATSRVASDAAPPLPMPSPPYDTCTGAVAYPAVLELVTRGRATLLVKATVTGDAVADGPNSKVVPVQGVVVLAGKATAGTPQMIQHTELEQYNDLPRGTYLMLLSHYEGSVSTYSLASGLPGSFVAEGDTAFERCANEADPAHPLLAAQGAKVVDLVANVERALEATQFGPESTGYSIPSPLG